MKPSSIWQDGEMTLRHDHLGSEMGLKNRTEVQRRIITIAERYYMRASIGFTNDLEMIKRILGRD